MTLEHRGVAPPAPQRRAMCVSGIERDEHGGGACGRTIRARMATVTAGHSRIFDIPVDLGQPDELLHRIAGWVGHGGPTRKVMYVNAHVLNLSREYPALRAGLEAADLVYCDGYG